MSKPKRIQLSRRKGWRMPPNTLKVDRTTKWGNPFVTSKDGDRAYCVKLFTFLLGGFIALGRGTVDEQRAYLKYAHANIWRLKGKNLACWCPLDAPCHADVLLEAAAKWRGRKRAV